MTLFQYLLMDHTKSWDGKKKLALCYQKKTTVDLTAIYNSTDNEENDETKTPI